MFGEQRARLERCTIESDLVELRRDADVLLRFVEHDEDVLGVKALAQRGVQIALRAPETMTANPDTDARHLRHACSVAISVAISRTRSVSIASGGVAATLRCITCCARLQS